MVSSFINVGPDGREILSNKKMKHQAESEDEGLKDEDFVPSWSVEVDEAEDKESRIEYNFETDPSAVFNVLAAIGAAECEREVYQSRDISKDKEPRKQKIKTESGASISKLEKDVRVRNLTEDEMTKIIEFASTLERKQGNAISFNEQVGAMLPVDVDSKDVLSKVRRRLKSRQKSLNKKSKTSESGDSIPELETPVSVNKKENGSAKKEKKVTIEPSLVHPVNSAPSSQASGSSTPVLRSGKVERIEDRTRPVSTRTIETVVSEYVLNSTNAIKTFPLDKTNPLIKKFNDDEHKRNIAFVQSKIAEISTLMKMLSVRRTDVSFLTIESS